MKRPLQWLPKVSIAVAVVWLAAAAWPRSDSRADWHYRAFGRLPVVQEGRVMPLDTVGRLALMSINHRQGFYYGTLANDGRERDKKSFSASKWLLDCMALTDQDTRMELPLVRIDDQRLIEQLGLESRKSGMYSIRELSPGLRPIINAGREAVDPAIARLLGQLQPLMAQEKDNLPIYEYRVFRIENDQVLNLVKLRPRDGLRYSFREIIDAGGKDLEDEFKRIHKVKPADRNLFDNKVAELYQHVQLLIHLTNWRGPMSIPPDDGGDSWQSLSDQLMSPLQGRLPSYAQASYLQLLAIYHLGAVNPLGKDQPDPALVAQFNETLAGFHDELDKTMPDTMRRVRLEAWFNEFAPFYHCSILYALIAILGCVSWLVSFRAVNRAALGAMLVVFAVHTIALCCRMYIQGRPPVTNLYSSAIFIGWGCVLTCLVVELLCRYSIALIVGSVTGSLSLVVAHFLSLDGDTLGMLQAVLDTNFWLATHVVCITLGYTATFVAGFMGAAYILLGVMTPLLHRDVSDIFPAESGSGAGQRHGPFGMMLSKMTYGVICFAMLLSFTGTVLGGIWADQSWGRFWGWDPKENGALLIVIWNALILHARWGGMVKQRGIAVLAVFGNVITAWSWFGTNLLGIGLHAYGFMKGAMLGMVLFDASQLAIMALGLLPLTMWRSYQHLHPPATPAPSRELTSV